MSCLLAFVLACIVPISHGYVSPHVREGFLRELANFKGKGYHASASQSQGLASHLLEGLAASLLAVQPGVKFRPAIRPVVPHARLQHPPRMFWKKQQEVQTATRPTEGDIVVIKSTPNTREYCPSLIGTKSAILVDAGDHQPYQVESSSCWFTVDDVEPTKEKKDMMEGLAEREVTKLANSEEFQAKIDEAARENKALVIGFFATWCRACKATKPKFMKITQSWPNVEFCEILFDNNKDLAREKGIKSLPFFEIYTGDKERIEAFQCGPSKIGRLEETLKDNVGYGI
jgi:thiol-disulfide isomerase/thioredoxin